MDHIFVQRMDSPNPDPILINKFSDQINHTLGCETAMDFMVSTSEINKLFQVIRQLTQPFPETGVALDTSDFLKHNMKCLAVKIPDVKFTELIKMARGFELFDLALELTEMRRMIYGEIQLLRSAITHFFSYLLSYDDAEQ